MRNCAILLTNNSSLRRWISSTHLVKGSSLDVLVTVRDAVHGGAYLLTHPLCGNLRPHQQPFRSVLIKEISDFPEEVRRLAGSVPVGHPARVDLDSLSMIEEAVLLYRAHEDRLLLPENLPEATREDYAFIDAELMRESLAQYGLLPEGFANKAENGLAKEVKSDAD